MPPKSGCLALLSQGGDPFPLIGGHLRVTPHAVAKEHDPIAGTRVSQRGWIDATAVISTGVAMGIEQPWSAERTVTQCVDVQ